MKTIRNKTSTDRQVAETGDVAAPGGTVDVPDEVADGLLEQEDVWGPPDVHECPFCDFEAQSAGGLTTHRKTHDEEND